MSGSILFEVHKYNRKLRYLCSLIQDTRSFLVHLLQGSSTSSSDHSTAATTINVNGTSSYYGPSSAAALSAVASNLKFTCNGTSSGSDGTSCSFQSLFSQNDRTNQENKKNGGEGEEGKEQNGN